MEKEVQLLDEKGETVATMVQFEDIMLPKALVKTTLEQEMKEIKNITYKDGDILLNCSFLKTGTHWVNNLIKLLLYYGPIEDSPSHVPMCIENPPTEDFLTQPSPRVLHSHSKLNRIPPAFLEKGKLVLLLRNPKDTAVAFFQYFKYHPFFKLEGKWDFFVRSFLRDPYVLQTYPSYLNSMQKALRENKNIDIHIVYFEDLKRNGLEELRKLQHHLGYNHSDERLQAILDRCTVKRLAEDVDEGKTGAFFKDSSGKQILYRKGEVGDWKNYFTVAQSEAFDSEWDSHMKDSMFRFQYE